MSVIVERGHLADGVRRFELEVDQREQVVRQVRGTFAKLPDDGRAISFAGVLMEPEPATATVTLRDESNHELLNAAVEFVPVVRYPNGKRCPPRAVIATLHVTEDGEVHPGAS